MEAKGIHIMATLYGVPFKILDDISYIEELISLSCEKAGATQINILSYKFEPQGVTVLALLAESHLSIHNYSEHGISFVDIFTCGRAATPEKAIQYIIDELKPIQYKIDIIARE